MGNASEWVSRANYVLTAALALVVLVVDMGGVSEKEGGVVKEVMQGWVLGVVYVGTYGMGFCKLRAFTS